MEKFSKDVVLMNDELLLSLKSHIDSQYKLNQINQSRIRSFERFRRYCQRVASFGNGDGTTVFDTEQFQNEYARFDRNYRYWRKRIRKLRKEINSSLSTRYQNPYDTLYELFAKIEILERNKENLNDPNKDAEEQQQSTLPINPANKVQIQELDIQSDVNSDDGGQKITKHRRCGPPKTKNTTIQYLSPDQIYPEISINVIEPIESPSKSFENINDSNDFLPDNYGMLNYSSDSSEDVSETKSTRSRRQTKKSTGSKEISIKDKVEAKSPKKNTAASSNQDVQNKIIFPRGKPKKLTTSRKVYPCDYVGCHYSTTISSNLKLHMRSHSDERPFPCDKCDFAFKMKADLKRHLDMHEGKRFECSFEDCNANYSMLKNLQKHVKIVHTKQLPLLSCDWEGCRYSTYHSNCLKTHRKIHDGRKPHKCPYCEKAFNSPANLWSHKLKHQNGNIWKCDLEGCTYSTYRNAYLKNHKLIHNEDRPFTCAWPGCGDSFKTPTSLGKHRLMHENLRRYKCSWDGCDYASNVSNGLRTHVEAVHEKIRKPRKRKRTNNKQNLLDSNMDI